MRISNEEARQQRENERRTWGDPATVRLIQPGGFFDGNLVTFFEALGQNPRIDENEIRQIPQWLLNRCIQSGANFERV